MDNAYLVNGRYRIDRRLGGGGIGEIYAAVHAFTQQPVAIKLVRRFDLERSADLEALVLREAAATAAVTHDHVVEILDAGREPNGDLFLVFEYLLGQDLETALSAGRLDLEDILGICGNLLEALGAVHRSGYVHRDVKPSNIFLTHHGARRDWVKLIDFGNVAPIPGPQGAEPEGSPGGTLEYMSPEQIQGGRVDGRADIWSVGTLLFRAVTGRLPIEEREPFRYLRRLTEQGVPPLAAVGANLPLPLCSIVDKALAIAPENRFRNATDMAQALLLVDLAEDARSDPCHPDALRLRTSA